MRRLATGVALVAVAAVAAAVSAQGAAPARPQGDSATSRPFGAGERLEFDVRFSGLRVGRASLEAVGVVPLRGQAALRTVFTLRGGTWFYHIEDVLESWLDTARVQSLRFVQKNHEGSFRLDRTYDLFPERRAYRESADTADQPSVADPLDEGAFLYFVRTLPLEPGRTYEFARYFRPDRNPVVIRVLRRERVRVPAGTFDAIVIQPIFKSRGLFAEGGEAQLWLRDDPSRIVLQMTSRLPVGTLSLVLTSFRPPFASPGAAR